MGGQYGRILKFSRETAFTPETIEILAAALDEVWKRMRQSGSRLTRPEVVRVPECSAKSPWSDLQRPQRCRPISALTARSRQTFDAVKISLEVDAIYRPSIFLPVDPSVVIVAIAIAKSAIADATMYFEKVPDRFFSLFKRYKECRTGFVFGRGHL